MVLPAMNRRDFVFGAAALVVAPEAFASRLGGTPTALVTADLESHVVAIDLSTGRRMREIATHAGPRSIESVGSLALVAHTTEGFVTLIDGPSLRVRKVLGGFSEPRYAAASPGGRYVFVTDSGRGELVVVDVGRGAIAARVQVGGPARHLSFDAARGTVWTSLGNKAERVAVVDVRRPTRPRLLRSFTPPFLAHDVGFGPAGRVWVTSGDRGELALYDRRGRRVPLFGHAPPQHVSFVGGLAFVTSGDDGTLRVHSARTGRLVARARIPVGSYNVQQGWGRVLMPSLSRGTLCIADGRGRVIRTVHVARSSHDACFVMSA